MPARARSRPVRRRARSCSRGSAWRWLPRGCSRPAPSRARRSAASPRRCRWRPRPPASRSSASSPTTTRRSPSSRPSPRNSSIPCSSSQGSCAGVVEVVDDLVAAVEHRLGVEIAAHRRGDARHPSRLGEQVGRVAAAPSMACRRSRSTRRRPGAARRSRPQAAVGEAAGADLARGAGPEHDRVELSLTHRRHRTIARHIARGRQASTWSIRAKGCRSRLPEASLNPGTNQYVRTMSSPSLLSQ